MVKTDNVMQNLYRVIFWWGVGCNTEFENSSVLDISLSDMLLLNLQRPNGKTVSH